MKIYNPENQHLKMNKKVVISIFCMFLIVSMPVAAQSTEYFKDRILGNYENAGESIIVQVFNIEPKVLPSSLLEEENVPIYVQLGGIKGVPLGNVEIKNIVFKVLKASDYEDVEADIPSNLIGQQLRNWVKENFPQFTPAADINDVDLLKDLKVYIQKSRAVTGTSEEVLRNFYKSYQYIKPQTYSNDNFGYLVVYLKKTPKEADMPDKIEVDFRAEVYYESQISNTIGALFTNKVLQETSEVNLRQNPSAYRFGNNYYLRVSAIDVSSATFDIYDQNYKRIRTTRVREGEISSSFVLGDSIFDTYRIKLNQIEDVSTTFKIQNVDGNQEVKQNENILDSGWSVSTFNSNGDNEGYIILKNKDLTSQASLIFTTESLYSNVESLKQRISGCIKILEGDLKLTSCNPYEDSKFITLRGIKHNKEQLSFMLNDLTKLDSDLLQFKFLGIKKSESKINQVKMNVQGIGIKDYTIGDPFGEGCSIKGIGVLDSIVVQFSDGSTKGYRQGQTYTDCGGFSVIDVVDTRSISVDILPGSGKGKATSDISVQVPIEKRLIKLSPEAMSDHINKTQDYIKKLDNTINKLDGIVQDWTQVCLGTAALFTILTFFAKIPETKKAITEGTETTTAEQTQVKPSKTSFSQIVDLNNILNKNDAYIFLSIDPSVDPSGKVGGNSLIRLNDPRFKDSQVDQDGNVLVNQGGNEVLVFNLNQITVYEIKNYNPNTFKTNYAPLMSNQAKKYRFDKLNGKYVAVSKVSFSELVNSPNFRTISYEKGLGFIMPITRAEQLGDQSDLFYSTFHTGMLYLKYYKGEKNEFRLWSAGNDGRLTEFGGKQDGDAQIAVFNEPKLRDRILGKVENKFGGVNVEFGGDSFKLDNTVINIPENVECKAVLGEGRCTILFNACDPVMCPPSRYTFDGIYRVDNVIQSGLIGSLMLGLPNFKNDKVLVPVCLTGVLASLKNIKSVLQGYVQCLEAARDNQESIGICDKIKSIYVCELLWKELYTFLKIRGGILGYLFNKASGGGEYLGGVKARLDNSRQFLSYFTQDYATSVFASYKGKTAKQVGSDICQSSIYGKYPVLGDVLNEVSAAVNPPQFTAYFEEEPYSIAIAGESRYQVYYHIYAGDEQVDYAVYLKKDGVRRLVPGAQGRILPDLFVDESKDFIGIQGFTKVCVVINGEENCGDGKIASTSFGLNAVNEYMIKFQLDKNIQEEDDCLAETWGIVPQAALEKTCFASNPGQGIGVEETKKWVKIGTCGTDDKGANLGGCWMKIWDLRSNPYLFNSVASRSCESQNGYVCKAGEQVCPGTPIFNVASESTDLGASYTLINVPFVDQTYQTSYTPFQATTTYQTAAPVSRQIELASVLCCNVPCVESSGFANAQKTYTEMLETIAEEDRELYENAKAVSEFYCGNYGFGDLNAVAQTPEWEKVNEMIKDFESQQSLSEENKKRYQQLLLLKAVLYKSCGDCDNYEGVVLDLEKQNLVEIVRVQIVDLKQGQCVDVRPPGTKKSSGPTDSSATGGKEETKEKTAQDYFELGKTLYNVQKYEEAIKNLLEVRTNGGDKKLLDRAWLYIGLSYYDLAKQQLKDKNNNLAKNNLLQVLSYLKEIKSELVLMESVYVRAKANYYIGQIDNDDVFYDESQAIFEKYLNYLDNDTFTKDLKFENKKPVDEYRDDIWLFILKNYVAKNKSPRILNSLKDSNIFNGDKVDDKELGIIGASSLDVANEIILSSSEN